MEKKPLSKLAYNTWFGFSNKGHINQVEKYLASSFDLYDLDYRQKELDRKGFYKKLYTK